MTTTTPPQSIAHCYQFCIESFEKVTVGLDNLVASAVDQDCVNKAQPAPHFVIQDQIGRFRVWAGNTGAHQKGRLSLDYELREAAHIHNTVLELLEELNRSLMESV